MKPNQTVSKPVNQQSKQPTKQKRTGGREYTFVSKCVFSYPCFCMAEKWRGGISQVALVPSRPAYLYPIAGSVLLCCPNKKQRMLCPALISWG